MHAGGMLVMCLTSEFLGDDGGGDLLWCAISSIVVGMQGHLRWCPMVSEMEDLALSGMNRAECVNSRKCMSECFTMCGILLVSVGEGDQLPWSAHHATNSWL